MYGQVAGVTVVGIDGVPFTVESHVGRGLPSLTLTGLPGATVRDARDRIRPAVETAGLTWPLRRIVVNLAPASLRKDGPGLDLAIAMGVLVATAQVPGDRAARYAFVGELSLQGDLIATPGVLAAAIAIARRTSLGIVVPRANHAEAALVDGLEVVAAATLADVVRFLRGSWSPPEAPEASVAEATDASGADLAEVRGQVQARRAIEIAAAGGHNVLFVGPPGAGKTMLARRLTTVLPVLTRSEALEVTRLRSVAGLLPAGLARTRPFRAPHHSISMSGLLGGGSSVLRPGEVSLAHRGVLFLDELSEFRRDALESLRQPLEEGVATVVRASGAVAFPARFTLVAASNPCPCGYEGDALRQCTCAPHRVDAHRQRISGPLLDRIDIRLAVPRLTRAEMLGGTAGESSAQIRARVEAARARQGARWGEGGITNAEAPARRVREVVRVDGRAADLLDRAIATLGLSGRGLDRVLRVARTIGDLADAEAVGLDHLAEAISLRAPTVRREHAGVG